MTDIRFLLKSQYGASRALVIGIDHYLSASPLSYAVSDAVSIRDILVDKFGFPTTDVILLTNEVATKQNILRNFLRFANEDVGLDDRVVVFFAGHGHTRTGSRGEIGYLVPHDADMKDFSTFIRWDELTRNADLIRAKHVFFIMDACYGGLALVRTASSGSTRFLKDMLLRTSRQVLTAGKANEVVADSGGPLPNHSVFTGHLIKALEGNAATGDGVLTVSAVMAYVHFHVANDKNSNQTPHYGHVDGDGDMVLLAPQLGELNTSEKVDLDRLISVPHFDATEDISSIAAKMRRAKELLASDVGSIELHDLLVSEVRRFLSLTSEDNFAPVGEFVLQEFVSRLERYESASLDIALLFACVAHWGRSTHFTTLQKCLARSSDRLGETGGNAVWLALRWYPLLLELYCVGIAAIDARRFDTLSVVFNTRLPGFEHRRTAETFLDAAANAIVNLSRTNVLKKIPGHENNYVPLSEYLFKVLQPHLDDAFFIGKNYEAAFDTFEVYFALSVVDARLVRNENAWGPIGRFGWKSRDHNSPLERVVREARESGRDWNPLKVGMFGGDVGRFEKAAEQLESIVGKLSWY